MTIYMTPDGYANFEKPKKKAASKKKRIKQVAKTKRTLRNKEVRRKK